MNLENQFNPSLLYVILFSALFYCRILNSYSDSAVAQKITQQLQGTEFEPPAITSKLFSYTAIFIVYICSVAQGAVYRYYESH